MWINWKGEELFWNIVGFKLSARIKKIGGYVVFFFSAILEKSFSFISATSAARTSSAKKGIEILDKVVEIL